MNGFISPTSNHQSGDEIENVSTDIQLELIADDIQSQMEKVSDQETRARIQDFLIHYLDLKSKSKEKGRLDRDSVLKELKESLDHISNDTAKQTGGNDNNSRYGDATGDILTSASATLSRLQDLASVRRQLSKTNGLLGNLCENLDWKMKAVEDIGITADDWAIYPRGLLADMKEKLVYAMKFSMYARRNNSLDAINDGLKTVMKESDKWGDRLVDLQDVLERKKKRADDLKHEKENHEGNILRESDRSKIKTIEERGKCLMQDFISALSQTTTSMSNVLLEMNKNTRKIHSDLRLRDDHPSVAKIVDAFLDLNAILQNSVSEMKAKAMSQPRDLCRLRKLQSIAKQVEKEFQTLVHTEAKVNEFTQHNIRALTTDPGCKIDALLMGSANNAPLKDHVTFCVNLFKNTVSALNSASEITAFALSVATDNNRSVRFGSFKLDVIKFDLLNTNSYSERMLHTLDSIMVSCSDVTRKTLMKHTLPGLPVLRRSKTNAKTTRKKSRTRTQSQGHLPKIDPNNKKET